MTISRSFAFGLVLQVDDGEEITISNWSNVVGSRATAHRWLNYLRRQGYNLRSSLVHDGALRLYDDDGNERRLTDHERFVLIAASMYETGGIVLLSEFLRDQMDIETLSASSPVHSIPKGVNNDV